MDISLLSFITEQQTEFGKMMLGITEGTMKILIKSNTHTDTHTLQPHFLGTLIDQPPNNFKLRQGEIIYKLT